MQTEIAQEINVFIIQLIINVKTTKHACASFGDFFKLLITRNFAQSEMPLWC